MRFAFFLSLALISTSACGPAKTVCNTSTCSGCCDANGECQSGVTATACGSGGLVCQTCSQFTQCQLGYCMVAQTGGGTGGASGGGSGGGTGGGSGGGTGGGLGGGSGGGTGGGFGGGTGGGFGGGTGGGFGGGTGGGFGGGTGGGFGGGTGGGFGGGTGGGFGGGTGGGSGGGTGGGFGGGTGGGSGGGGGSGSCSPANCTGCCSGTTCIPYPNSVSNTTCGTAGQVCVNCSQLGGNCNTSTAMCSFPTGGGSGGGFGGGTGGGTGGGFGGGTGGGTGVHVGNDQPFPNDGSMTENYLLGTRITVSQTLLVTHFGVIGRATGSTGRFALYTDVGGVPGQLRASSQSAAIVVGTLEIPAVTPTTITPGSYWLMGNYSPAAHVGKGGTSVTIQYVALPFTSPLPTTFPTPTSYSGEQFNYYLVGF